MRRYLPLVLFAVTIGAACCGSSPPASKARVPVPAGNFPSQISKMVCSSEAQKVINHVLGVTADVATPTWVGHLYSCRYQYPDGVMTLSVKELSSWSQTDAWYHMLGRQLGDISRLGNLGQGAFTTTNGSVVVRKDWKVLTVQISGLPAQFGVPPTSRADVADTVSDLILGCWAGD
ncbi:MAG TPA: hypothetical protein VNC61_13320 [Acidimicrobiales bacterium]|nr:hypothetical protein [Acidimicrobiales bacterium]